MSKLTIIAVLALAAVPAIPIPSSAAESPLVQAAAAGDIAAVRAFIKQGQDVNDPGQDGATALHWVVRADDLETVEALIKAGASVTQANAFGMTPAYIAAENGSTSLLRRLLDAGADPNTADRSGDTLLMATVRAGKLDAVQLLLERGANVNAAEPALGHTVLMWAVRENQAALAKLLIERGAGIEARTRVGAKPTARPPGAGGGSHGVGIVRGGVPPQGEQQPQPGGMTPLLFAARDGMVAAAEVLIAAKADLNAADPNGMTPLMMAITNNKLDVAQLLVEQGADVRAADWWGRTPLWAAVEIASRFRSGATENGVDRDARSADRGDHRARRRREPTRQEFPPQRRHLLGLGTLEWWTHRPEPRLSRRAVGRRAECGCCCRRCRSTSPPHGTTALMTAAGVNWVIGQTFASRSTGLEAVKLCLELGATSCREP